MRVIAGSVILEPGLQACDFTELAEQGVTLAKAGFVRRVDTAGGKPPAVGCDAGHAGKEARMRYSAVYEFYAAGD